MMKKLLFIGLFLLVATTNQAQITLSGQSTPAIIVQGTEVTVSLTYTSTVPVEEWQIQLFTTNEDGSINYGGPNTQIYIGNNYTGSNPPIEGKSLPIATQPTTLTFKSYCDPANVPVGDNYKWFVKLKETAATPESGAVYGNNDIQVTVTSALATDSFKSLSSVFFINSSLKTLQVFDNSNQFKSVNIYTLEGKKVKTIQNIGKNSNYDLSMFPAGYYILSTSDNRSMKFSLN